MMKAVRKVLTLSIVACMFISGMKIDGKAASEDSVFVEEIVDEIQSDGSFSFSFNTAMQSGSFTVGASGNVLTMYIQATTPSTVKSFTVTLIGPDGYSQGYTINADGQLHVITYSGTASGKYYFLKFTKGIFTDTVTGSGMLYPVSNAH